jgi:MoCo/4Fe-4S cofactor protein with predicted Tat translocation signal
LESERFSKLLCLSSMKTIPPPCPEPETGLKYWRSLDQLAETPEFRQWVEREFPAGASEFTDPVGRRHFVKIMGASFLLGGLGLTGCRRPEEKILPFSKLPEGYVHGVAQYYATARPTRTGAVPLVVKSHEGRPTKVEGNPEHPEHNGSTDLFTQASILNLYDPDRAQRFAKGGNTATREEGLDFLGLVGRKFRANNGAGLAILMEPSASPSRDRVLQDLQKALPQARFYAHDPLDVDTARRAASQTFGQSVAPYYRLDKANVVVTLDADILGSEEDQYRLIRGFSKGRKLETKESSMNRLYAVEGLMTLTGVNADHRLRVATSQVAAVAAALGAEVIKASGNSAAQPLADALAKIALPAGVNPKWVQECAKDLVKAENKGKAVVVAGHRQPLAVHVIAQAINSALGSVGSAVEFKPVPAAPAGSLTELAQSLNAGSVDTLVVLGVNPAYTAPADLEWSTTQRKAKNVVRLGYYEDESFAGSDWHLPAAHYLESWGDARTSDGTYVPVQPLIEPMFGGLTEIEVLARLAGSSVVRPHDIVRETFRTVSGASNLDGAWKKLLHDGFLTGSAASSSSLAVNFTAAAGVVSSLTPSPAPSEQSLEVVFYRDYSLDDGRYNNNGWLQELPDPITKLTWDNAILQAVNQPMLCQHCEAAPCESVCPVNATVHDHEGLNVMAYNRCVGTRYCSNNCPYKVRRFNYLDYNKRSLKELKGPFYPTTLLHSTEGEWDLARWWKDQDAGMRQDDEWDLIRMLKNPDVTVRMRGVMEKCTFCVQRIEGAKIAQKVKAGESGDVVVPDGTIKTACEQACPAGAIVFGNIADEKPRGEAQGAAAGLLGARLPGNQTAHHLSREGAESESGDAGLHGVAIHV